MADYPVWFVIMLCLWWVLGICLCVVSLHIAFTTKDMRKFGTYSGLAIITSFFTTGPLCLLVWYSLIIRMIFLRGT